MRRVSDDVHGQQGDFSPTSFAIDDEGRTRPVESFSLSLFDDQVDCSRREDESHDETSDEERSRKCPVRFHLCLLGWNAKRKGGAVLSSVDREFLLPSVMISSTGDGGGTEGSVLVEETRRQQTTEVECVFRGEGEERPFVFQVHVSKHRLERWNGGESHSIQV